MKVRGLDRSGSEQGHVGCCECGNEPSGSIKCGEFPDTKTQYYAGNS